MRISRCGGFTLQDLAGILTTLSLLGFVFLTAGAGSGRLERTFACADHLRQLSFGWLMYADDNNGSLPLANAVGAPPGTGWVHGWLDFSSTNADNTNTANLINPQRATIGPYVRDPSLFRCPADLGTVRHPSGTVLPRVRSYSMNEAMGTTTSLWLPSPVYRTFTKRDDITKPAPVRAWVLTEEHPDSINDGVLAVQMAEASSATQARIIDYPSALHDGAANLAFADGHVELRNWVDARTRPPVRYQGTLALNVASPNNPDVLWLSERTSSRRR